LEKTIATLKHDIHQLQLEHDLLQKANELLKNAPHGSPSPFWGETLRAHDH
jgi:hypothetical protein